MTLKEELAALPLMPESEIYLGSHVCYIPTAIFEWAINEDRDVLMKTMSMIGSEPVYMTGGNFDDALVMLELLASRTPWNDGGYAFYDLANGVRADIRMRKEWEVRYAARMGRVAA
jgi:hypothetical protein